MDIPGRERVPGATSPQQDCSLEEIMKDDAAVWNSLARGLCVGEEVIVGGETLSKQACCIHALELDPHNSAVWHALAVTIPKSDARGVAVGGVSYTRQACYIRALELNPHKGDLWYNLGNSIPEGGGRHHPWYGLHGTGLFHPVSRDKPKRW